MTQLPIVSPPRVKAEDCCVHWTCVTNTGRPRPWPVSVEDHSDFRQVKVQQLLVHGGQVSIGCLMIQLS